MTIQAKTLPKPVRLRTMPVITFGRETHKLMLEHYQQTKNLLVRYRPKALGLF